MPKKDNPGNSYNPKRRKLLKILGLGSAVLAGKSAASQVRVTTRTEQPIRQLTTTGPQLNYISITLLRPEDLLSLELRYHNFNLTGTTLQRKSGAAYLVVIFQPQAMSEQAWNEDASGLETPTVPGRIMIGGESRLVFDIPADISSIPLNLNDLLAWEKYNLVVSDRAKDLPYKLAILPKLKYNRLGTLQQRVNARDFDKNVKVVRGISKDEKIVIANTIFNFDTKNSRADAILNFSNNLTALANLTVGPIPDMQTSLEVPMRLYLSPTKNAGWAHTKKLSSAKGIIKETNRMFELWHTRMGIKTNKGIDESDLTNEHRIVRALWADDADKDYTAQVIEKSLDPYLGLTSLTNKDRHQIVHESSNFLIPKFLPPPVRARKLFLTTLGAWLTSEFIVERKKLQDAGVLQGNGNSLNVLSWKHIATMGRDHYVEIVKAGNILPFGHEAVLVKITERKPHAGTGTAANFKREFVIITEPVKDYNYHDSNGAFMNFCFSKVEFVTTTSPLLDSTKQGLVIPATGVMGTQNQFLIRSKNENVLFKIKAEDLDGNLIDMSLPLAFVSTDAQDNGSNIDALVSAYNAGFKISSIAPLFGQKFTLAPPVANGCDTAYVANDISFGAIKYVNADEPQGFLPVMKEAHIIEPSYQKLTGVGQAVSVSLVDDNNGGSVFAKFNFSQPVNFGGQSDKTGGMATPNFNLSGLSKAAGAFGGDIEKFKSVTASADDFFNVSSLPDPKLFGVFKLSEILDFVAGDASSYDLSKPLLNRAPKIPNLTTEETADEFITSYVINPKLKNVDLGFAEFKQKGGASFAITTQVKTKKKNPVAPEFSTDAWVRAFKISLLDDLVSIDFDEIRFSASAGKKADVSVKMANPCIVFGGPLTFINEVNKLIPSDGFSDPPYLDVSLTGIKCGYTLALPNLQMGAFTLSNISLGAEVNLPFTGGPLTIGFRFCERQQPFTLTISCLGGGGFFGMEADMNGLRQIEAALEFGAAVSINLGVASGSVSIMAGIYFKMTFESGHNSTQLTGYVRVNGEVSVLGLITASLELYLALTWLIDKKKAYGEASLKIKVEVLFFSTSVTVHTQRTFAGNGSDPNFQMAITQNDWTDYCGAFAA